jgi:acyl carrier protein
MSNKATTEISLELCKFITENLVALNVKVEPEMPLEKLGLDSFSIIEIILFIERKYGLTLPDHELTKENIYSPDSLAKCVVKYI